MNPGVGGKLRQKEDRPTQEVGRHVPYLRGSDVIGGRHVLRNQEGSEAAVELLVGDPHGESLPTNADDLSRCCASRRPGRCCPSFVCLLYAYPDGEHEKAGPHGLNRTKKQVVGGVLPAGINRFAGWKARQVRSLDALPRSSRASETKKQSRIECDLLVLRRERCTQSDDFLDPEVNFNRSTNEPQR